MDKLKAGNLMVSALSYSRAAVDWFEAIRHLPAPVLLSSGTSSHPAARYDLVAADPHTMLTTVAGLTHIRTREGLASTSTEAPFRLLAQYCPLDGDSIEGLPFTGGALGYFGYELLHGQHGIARKEAEPAGLPDMAVGIHDWAVVVDHHRRESHLVCRGAARARRDELLALLQSPPRHAAEPFALTAPFRSNFSRQDYLERFGRIIDYIHAGDCYQVNLAQCFTAACTGDSFQAFQRLQRHANAPFAAYIETGGNAVLSFSPERFIRVQDGEVLTQPIKGTRPRSADPAQDLANRLDLEGSPKDRAENLMIVDLLRNDLGRICATGSVSARELFETQSFTNVHHLVSTVRGRLAAPGDVFALLEAAFPGGSITGTPKRRAMEIIDELETRRRSLYCGVIGWIDHSGNMDSNICIRTLVRSGNAIHCWGGGGIVADSAGSEELQETIDKISIFINNL